MFLSAAVRHCASILFTVRGHFMLNQTDTPLIGTCLTRGLLSPPEFRMTMRRCKLALLAIAVLLQVHTGASYLLWAKFSKPAGAASRTYYSAGNTSRVDNAGTRMVGHDASPPEGGVLVG